VIMQQRVAKLGNS